MTALEPDEQNAFGAKDTPYDIRRGQIGANRVTILETIEGVIRGKGQRLRWPVNPVTDSEERRFPRVPGWGSIFCRANRCART